MFSKKLQFSHNQEVQHYLPHQQCPTLSRQLTRTKKEENNRIKCSLPCEHTKNSTHPGREHQESSSQGAHSPGLRCPCRGQEPEGSLQVRPGVLHTTHTSPTHWPRATAPNLCSNSQAKWECNPN